MKMPSVQVMPTLRPVPRRMWAMKRVVVVLPLTPVTATIGIRPFSPSANSVSTIASPTGRGHARPKAPGASASRGGVDFDHDAALLFQRPADVQGHHVDAGDVQADHLGRFDRAGGHLGMDQLGHVDGRAAGAQVARCGG